jgi:uncharacterized protein
MSESFQTGGIYMEHQQGDGLLLIDGYGDGGFRLGGQRIEGSLLVTETGFFQIEAKTSAELTLAHFKLLETSGTPVEVLLVGTGEKMMLLPAALRRALEKSGTGFELMDTGAAARTFNVLRMEDRRVAVFLIQIP